MSSSATTAKPPSQPALEAGLSALNQTIGAPVHHDLYRTPGDPEVERAELLRQCRVLGLGFLVVFSLIIGGVSLSLNGVWKQGSAVAFPLLPNSALPKDDPEDPRAEEAASRFRSVLPQFQVQGAAVTEWRSTQERDLAFDADDDPDPRDLEGLTPIQIYQRRVHVGTWYARLEAGETLALLRMPNLEPAPVRSTRGHAWEEARMFGLLPTRYPILFGLVMGALALLAPALLIPFFRFWMKSVAAPLGWFNTRVILGGVFYLMFTPYGAILALFRPDPLRRAQNAPGDSYWIEREEQRAHKHFQRMF